MLKILGKRNAPAAQPEAPVYEPELLDAETGLAGPELFMALLQRISNRAFVTAAKPHLWCLRL